MEDVTYTFATARCPRCRYDQRGHIPTWRDSCPLTGTCTECGLEFIWCEILLPEKFEPRWCVEFVPRARSVPWASVRTFVRSLWPWTFWSRLKMSQSIRPWRLVMYLLLMLLPIPLLYVAGQATVAYVAHTKFRQEVITDWQRGQLWISQLQGELQVFQDIKKLRGMGLAATEAQLKDITIPPQGMDHDRYIERLRASMNHPYMTDDHVEQSITNLGFRLSALRAQSGAPPRFSRSIVFAVLEAVFLPLRQVSGSTITYADQTTIPDLAPIDIHEMWITNYVVAGAIEDNLLLSARGLGAAFLLMLLLPLSFILLPASRRRAKIRWPHIWRIVVYSPGMFLLLLLLVAVVNIALGLRRRSPVAPLLIGTLIVPFWIVLPVWWAVAIKRYLKMPHAAMVAGVLTFMIALMMGPWLLDAMPYWLERMLFG